MSFVPGHVMGRHGTSCDVTARHDTLRHVMGRHGTQRGIDHVTHLVPSGV